MTATPAWAVWGATARRRQQRGAQLSRSGRRARAGPPSCSPLRYPPEPKWNTCSILPWMLEASQDTPSRLRALVTFTIIELLLQPLPSEGVSAGCGGLDQARPLGIKGWGGGCCRLRWSIIGYMKLGSMRARVPCGTWDRLRVARVVPYSMASLSPGEFGFRVASGGAGQHHFISFRPAIPGYGLYLVWFYLWWPCGWWGPQQSERVAEADCQGKQRHRRAQGAGLVRWLHGQSACCTSLRTRGRSAAPTYKAGPARG